MNDKLTNDQPMAMRSLIVVFGCLVAFWVARNTLRIERKVLVAQELPVTDVTATDKEADDKSETPVPDAAGSKVETSPLDPFQPKSEATRGTTTLLQRLGVQSARSDAVIESAQGGEDRLQSLLADLKALQGDLPADHPKTQVIQKTIGKVERWVREDEEPQRVLLVNVPRDRAKEYEVLLNVAFGDRTSIQADENSDFIVIKIDDEVPTGSVTALARHIMAGVATLDQNKPSKPVAQVANFPGDEQDRQYDRAAKELALKARDASPRQRDAFRKQLRQITEQQFDHRQTRRQQEFESLGKRLDELKAAQARRQTNRSIIVERRIDELLNPDAELKWDSIDPKSKDVTPSDQPGFAFSGAPLGNTALIPKGNRAETASEKKSSTLPTPTYNGMTLEQAMQTMASDRKPEKLVDAILAAYYLHSTGDERELAQTILQMLRFQNIDNLMSSHEAGFVEPLKQLSLAVLMRLPSDLVVEGLVAELKTHGTQKSPREFFEYLLQTYAIYAPIYSPIRTANNGMTVLITVNAQERTDAATRLRDSIRSRARTIVRCIAEIAQQEPKVGPWAIRCGFLLAGVTKQLISVFDSELGPIGERVFDDLRKNPKGEIVRNHDLGGTVVRNRDSVVFSARLLAGCNRRTDDVTKFAMSQIEIWQQGLDKEKKNVQQDIGVPKIVLMNAIEILLALAPHERDSSKQLITTFRSVWDQSEPARPAEADAVPRSIMHGDLHLYSVLALIDAMGQLGTLARDAIPILQEISESPDVREITTGSFGFYAGRKWRKEFDSRRDPEKLSEFAKAAIQAIEEAKPAEPPEPLPEDLAGSREANVEANRSSDQAKQSEGSSATSTGQSPVRPSTTPEALLTKMGLAGSLISSPPTPSYNGMTFEQALRIIATDRNTLKLLEAVAAANYLYESDEHQQIIRLILQMMRHQSRGAAGNASEDLVNATAAFLLMRCPPETVVDEFRAELITNGEKAWTTRDFFYSFIVRYRKIQNLYDGNQNQSVLLNLNGQDIVSVQSKMDEAIRRKARTLVGVISAIAMKEPDAANWGLDCGFQIANISKQPLTTFESELAPIAERLFDAFDVQESALGFNTQVEVVQLLGACNRRTIDLNRFADQKVKVWKETFDDENLSEVTSFNRRGALRLAAETIVATAAQSPESIPTLSELITFSLQQVDPSMLSLDNGSRRIVTTPGVRRGSHRQNELVADSVFTLVEALVRIGLKAESEIELLKRLATDPLASRLVTIDHFRQPWAKSIPRNNARVSLKDFIPAAIKAIEEAQPADPPEPLPEDVARDASPN